MTSEKVKQELQQLNDRMLRAENAIADNVKALEEIRACCDLWSKIDPMPTESTAPEVDESE